MNQYAPKWHTEHMAHVGSKVPLQVMHLRDRSKGTDVRIAIHARPCALCCAMVAEALWPDYSVMQPLHFEVAEIADGPAASPAKP